MSARPRRRVYGGAVKGCWIKTAYASREAAEMALGNWNKPGSVYRCPNCWRFHLTSRVS